MQWNELSKTKKRNGLLNEMEKDLKKKKEILTINKIQCYKHPFSLPTKGVYPLPDLIFQCYNRVFDDINNTYFDRYCPSSKVSNTNMYSYLVFRHHLP